MLYKEIYLKIVVHHNIFQLSIFNFMMENLKKPLNFDNFFYIFMGTPVRLQPWISHQCLELGQNTEYKKPEIFSMRARVSVFS